MIFPKKKVLWSFKTFKKKEKHLTLSVFFFFADLAGHSREEEGIHRESHSIPSVWDESGAILLAFNHTPLSKGELIYTSS